MKCYKLSKFNIYYEDINTIANTMTGAIFSFEKDEYRSICNLNWEAVDSILPELEEASIIVSERLNETGLLRYAYIRAKTNEGAARITICPTLECNFSCSYCYENRRIGKMSVEVQDKIISIIDNILKRGAKGIILTWYGGEPLLYPEIMEKMSKEVILLCQKYHVTYECFLISNGYRIHDVLTTLKKINLSMAQITLDGTSETHNQRRTLKNGAPTYDQILSGINLLSENNIKVKVRVNIDKENITAFQEINDLFKKSFNVTCYPAPVTKEDNQTKKQKQKCFDISEYQNFYSVMEEQGWLVNDASSLIGLNFCAAEYENSYLFDSDGYIYKCLNDIGKKEHAISHVNNINENSTIMIAEYLGRDPFTEPECRTCAYVPLCGGGCVWNYNKTGKHVCSRNRYQFDAIVYSKAKMI